MSAEEALQHGLVNKVILSKLLDEVVEKMEKCIKVKCEIIELGKR